MERLATISRDEYDKWVRPRVAFSRAYGACGDASSAAIALYAPLRDGLLEAGAQAVVFGSDEHELVIIPTQEWKGLKQLPSHSTFWQTGYLLTERYIGRGNFVSVSYHGVRFHRGQLAQILGDQVASTESPTEEQASGPKVEKKDLPQALLDEWAIVFRKAYRTGPEALAAQSVAGMFPHHEVSRTRLREALRKVGALKRGQKPENGD